MTATEPLPAPRKRGPATPEGKARSSMNALRHGLRARGFVLLPEEDPAEWGEHLADLRHDLAPADATEDKLVSALAAAMWNEIRADRTEAGVLTAMPLAGRHGRDLKDARNRLSLGTAIRYASAAGMATQRAHRAFLAHRKAKKQGLIRSVAATAANYTNDFAPAPAPEPAPANRTNDFPPARRLPEPDPLAALRARIQRLLAGTEPPDPDTRDLAAAILAVRLPGAPTYAGPIDLALLDRALEPLRFDAAALTRLAGLARSEPGFLDPSGELAA
ncbi:MAG: hypothetical protein AB7I59_25125 [Geminicoccaceae bacterium]